MTVDAWLTSACADAERRGMPELKPLLESLARAMQALRDSDDAFGHFGGTGPSRKWQMPWALRRLPSAASKPQHVQLPDELYSGYLIYTR